MLSETACPDDGRVRRTAWQVEGRVAEASRQSHPS